MTTSCYSSDLADVPKIATVSSLATTKVTTLFCGSVVLWLDTTLVEP